MIFGCVINIYNCEFLEIEFSKFDLLCIGFWCWILYFEELLVSVYILFVEDCE